MSNYLIQDFTFVVPKAQTVVSCSSEKKVITKQWAKRDEQINRVMKSTVGLYGDLQGIAGKTLQEIESLELGLLEVDE